MSVNENEKVLTWMRMRCVLCCMRTCWLADPLPADADECKQKRKRYLPHGGRGCVAFICVGVIYLCGCVRTCLLADVLPADADECKQKQKKYLHDGGHGCVAFVRVGVNALPADADECKQNEKSTYLMVEVDADVLHSSVLA